MLGTKTGLFTLYQQPYMKSIQQDNQTSTNDDVSFRYNVILDFLIREII